MTNAVLVAATELRTHGIIPVPLHPGSKKPMGKRWPERLPNLEDLPDLWPDDTHNNLGVQLGDASGGLVDVDCDCPQSIAAAKAVLGRASVQSGRGVAEASHYWFRITDEVPGIVQYLDPIDRTVIIELRGNGGQTVVPPSVHPDGTPYRWITPLDAREVDEVTAGEAHKMVRTIAAISLLAKHWPGPGARHHPHLALCGALLRDPDREGKVNEQWRTQAEGFVRLAASIGGDDHWWERDENVRTTIESIEAGRPVQGWTTLAKYLPHQVVWQVRDWLDLTDTDDDDLDEWDEEPETLDEAWRRVRLGEAITEGVPDPVDLLPTVAPGILFEGEVVTIQSAGGSGKTLIAMWLLYLLAERGQKVVFIDEENGPHEVARRLISLGADPEVLDRNFIYFAMPSVDWMIDLNARRLITLCEEEDVRVVLFDSVMDMMSSSGLDENSSTEFNSMYERTAKALKQSGVTTLFLDHLSKGSSLQARGASAKFDQASIVWGVKVEQKFDGNTAGHLVLKRRKGRLAVVEQEIHISVVPHEGRTAIAVMEGVEFSDEVEDAEEDRVTHIRREVVGYLHGLRANDAATGVTRTQVASECGLRKADVSGWFKAGHDEGFLGNNGDGRGSVVWAL